MAEQDKHHADRERDEAEEAEERRATSLEELTETLGNVKGKLGDFHDALIKASEYEDMVPGLTVLFEKAARLHVQLSAFSADDIPADQIGDMESEWRKRMEDICRQINEIAILQYPSDLPDTAKEAFQKFAKVRQSIDTVLRSMMPHIEEIDSLTPQNERKIALPPLPPGRSTVPVQPVTPSGVPALDGDQAPVGSDAGISEVAVRPRRVGILERAATRIRELATWDKDKDVRFLKGIRMFLWDRPWQTIRRIQRDWFEERAKPRRERLAEVVERRNATVRDMMSRMRRLTTGLAARGRDESQVSRLMSLQEQLGSLRQDEISTATISKLQELMSAVSTIPLKAELLDTMNELQGLSKDLMESLRQQNAELFSTKRQENKRDLYNLKVKRIANRVHDRTWNMLEKKGHMTRHARAQVEKDYLVRHVEQYSKDATQYEKELEELHLRYEKLNSEANENPEIEHQLIPLEDKMSELRDAIRERQRYLETAEPRLEDVVARFNPLEQRVAYWKKVSWDFAGTASHDPIMTETPYAQVQVSPDRSLARSSSRRVVVGGGQNFRVDFDAPRHGARSHEQPVETLSQQDIQWLGDAIRVLLPTKNESEVADIREILCAVTETGNPVDEYSDDLNRLGVDIATNIFRITVHETERISRLPEDQRQTAIDQARGTKPDSRPAAPHAQPQAPTAPKAQRQPSELVVPQPPSVEPPASQALEPLAAQKSESFSEEQIEWLNFGIRQILGEDRTDEELARIRNVFADLTYETPVGNAIEFYQNWVIDPNEDKKKEAMHYFETTIRRADYFTHLPEDEQKEMREHAQTLGEELYKWVREEHSDASSSESYGESYCKTSMFWDLVKIDAHTQGKVLIDNPSQLKITASSFDELKNRMGLQVDRQDGLTDHDLSTINNDAYFIARPLGDSEDAQLRRRLTLRRMQDYIEEDVQESEDDRSTEETFSNSLSAKLNGVERGYVDQRLGQFFPEREEDELELIRKIIPYLCLMNSMAREFSTVMSLQGEAAAHSRMEDIMREAERISTLPPDQRWAAIHGFRFGPDLSNEQEHIQSLGSQIDNLLSQLPTDESKLDRKTRVQLVTLDSKIQKLAMSVGVSYTMLRDTVFQPLLNEDYSVPVASVRGALELYKKFLTNYSPTATTPPDQQPAPPPPPDVPGLEESKPESQFETFLRRLDIPAFNGLILKLSAPGATFETTLTYDDKEQIRELCTDVERILSTRDEWRYFQTDLLTKQYELKEGDAYSIIHEEMLHDGKRVITVPPNLYDFIRLAEAWQNAYKSSIELEIGSTASLARDLLALREFMLRRGGIPSAERPLTPPPHKSFVEYSIELNLDAVSNLYQTLSHEDLEFGPSAPFYFLTDVDRRLVEKLIYTAEAKIYEQTKEPDPRWSQLRIMRELFGNHTENVVQPTAPISYRVHEGGWTEIQVPADMADIEQALGNTRAVWRYVINPNEVFNGKQTSSLSSPIKELVDFITERTWQLNQSA